MKVICAGLGKTGTTSLKRALQELGYNTYDYREHVTFHRQQWLNSFETDRIPDFVDMYKGVDAITDLPPAFWFEEIFAAFPDAKVILSMRDSEEKWVQSLVNHFRILGTIPFYTRIYFYIKGTQHFLNTLHEAVYGSSNPKATTLYRKKYRQHNERVQAVIPRDKLLIFNVKQGWEPLCKFLCCDVPSIPFPKVNVASTVAKQVLSEAVKRSRKFYLCVLFVVTILVAILSMFVLQ